jgi:prepilin-type processing-associated H-X9-DG protein
MLNMDSSRSQATRAAMRGAFVPRQKMGFRDMLDGLSNTIMCAEIASDLGDRDTRTAPRTGVVLGTTTPAQCAENFIDPTRPRFWQAGVALVTNTAAHARGFRWADGNPIFSGMLTIHPPNSPSCVTGAVAASDIVFEESTLPANFGNQHSTGYLGASSRHQGGCHILMGDGAIKFITDSVEAGQQTQLPVVQGGAGVQAPGRRSPYGLWGSLGTRASKEVIDDEI